MLCCTVLTVEGLSCFFNSEMTESFDLIYTLFFCGFLVCLCLHLVGKVPMYSTMATLLGAVDIVVGTFSINVILLLNCLLSVYCLATRC